jgi:hypothetical protein
MLILSKSKAEGMRNKSEKLPMQNAAAETKKRRMVVGLK